MIKRFLGLLVLSVVFLAAQPTVTAVEFADLDGHYAEEVILELAKMDIVRGDADGQVRPEDPITRAEFLALLLRAEDIDTTASSQGASVFEDVPAAHWAYPYIRTAKDMGIVNGIDATHFGPKANITREQAVAMIMRTSKAVQPIKTDAKTFTDISQGRWSEVYIQDAYRAQIADEVKPGLFEPTTPATRAQVMVMIRNLLQAETKAEYLPTDAELQKTVEDYVQTMYEVIGAGQPFAWDDIYPFVTGQEEENFDSTQVTLELLAEQGVKWNFQQSAFNATVITKTQHTATVSTEETIKLVTTAPNGKSTIEQTGKMMYSLRRVDDQWMIYESTVNPAQ